TPQFHHTGQEGFARRADLHPDARNRPILHRQGRPLFGGLVLPRDQPAPMSGEILITAGGILALVILAFLYSDAETAITASSKARLRSLEGNGDKRAAAVTRLSGKRDRMVSALLICNNLVKILASALAT